MSLKALLTGELTLGLRIRSVAIQRSYATISEPAKGETIDLTSVDTDPKFEDDQETRPDEIAQMRNKSRLSGMHRDVLNNRVPYGGGGPADFHSHVSWKRKILGRYGIEGSGADPGVAWPTKKDIAISKEYERVAYPYSLQEAWAKIVETNHANAERIRLREESITANLAKTIKWERDLTTRLAKKEAATREAKERKERLVEEVRRHFGFKINPKDEKFREMLEQKEKEDKKRKKDAKKKDRADRLMAKLMEVKAKEGSAEGQTPETNDKSKTPPDLP